MLGCDVQAFRPDCSRCGPGETGELVIAQPMPSMPVGFWGDDGSRYRAAYFEHFAGVWTHGYWIAFTEGGGCVTSIDVFKDFKDDFFHKMNVRLWGGRSIVICL